MPRIIHTCRTCKFRFPLDVYGQPELEQRFTVLAVGIVYRGCAIPVAWALVSATAKGRWKPLWLELVTVLQSSIPTEWCVIVLTDRGLYARWLSVFADQSRRHLQASGSKRLSSLVISGSCEGANVERQGDLFQKPSPPVYAPGLLN